VSAEPQSGAMQGRDADHAAYARAVKIIIGAILLIAVPQILYAWSIGNRFLIKDGFDWSYDVVLWGVALACFGRGLRAENLAALAIAGVMFVAGCHTAYDLWDKVATGRRPELWVAGWSSFTMIFIALLLLVVMWRFRKSENALVAATWLSSRNSIIITLGFAALNLVARTRSSQAPEIALDLLAIGLSFQAVYAILTKLRWYTKPDDAGESRG
jgi:divalent metal cation (Fe/Co/Zn/Cd) transporter